MVKATLNGQTLAESYETVFVEGNHYFPPSSVKWSLFTDSDTHTTCGWKGVATYKNANLEDGTKINDAMWYYPQCHDTPRAKAIEGYVAFYKNKVNIA